MTGASPVWRAILWIERFLPAAPSPVPVRRNRWAAAIPGLVFVPIVIRLLLGSNAAMAQAWPIWRSLTLDALFVVSVGLVLAAMTASFVSWRKARS